MFNNDIRLRALKTLADTLAPIEQKKSIIYFSAGMQRSGQDNQVELRAAINAAVRANVAFYSIDTRGLQAVVPGGDARQASGRGNAMFSGRGVAQQYDTLAGSQDTLTSLAADTGGRAFTDTNDFGEAFARVQSDMSAYYLLAYSSSNPTHDGRYRRIQVRVKRDGCKVESRSGYYADRDFTHTSRGDRETQLQDQLFAAVSATDLPVMVTAGWFRLAADRYYVPVALAVPGYAVPGRQRDRQGDARRARHGARRAGPAARPLPRNAAAPARNRQDARRQAGALSVRRHAAARPLLGEGGRARERHRPDGHLRSRRSRCRS